MMTPADYADLFATLYPEYRVAGLADESQISVADLNERLSAIRANERALRAGLAGLAAAGHSGEFLRALVLPYWEVVATRRFQFTAAGLASSTFRAGFDAAGAALSFPVAQLVLPMNDLGGALVGEECTLLVFADGVLLPRSAWTGVTVQGGAVVYATLSLCPAGVPIDVVALQKFNVPNPSGRFTWEAPGPATPSAPLSFVFPASLYGRVYGVRHLVLFVRTSADQFFRPLDPSLWASRPDDTGDNVSFTVLQAGAGDAFMVVDLTEYWESYYEGPIGEADTIRFQIPLLATVGGASVPAPVVVAEDLQVWWDGRLRRAGTDYTLSFDAPGGPILAFNGMAASPSSAVLVVKGAPYIADDCIEYWADQVPDPHGVVLMPADQRVLRLIPRLGMLHAIGLFSSACDAEVIAENIGLQLPARSAYQVYYRLRLVLPDGARPVVAEASAAKGPVEQIIDVLATDPGNPPGTVFAANYVAVARPAVLPLVAPPASGGATGALGAYAWVSDVLPALRADHPVIVIGNRPGDQLMGVYQDATGLAPYVAPVSGNMIFDCRGGAIDPSLPSRPLDGRRAA